MVHLFGSDGAQASGVNPGVALVQILKQQQAQLQQLHAQANVAMAALMRLANKFGTPSAEQMTRENGDAVPRTIVLEVSAAWDVEGAEDDLVLFNVDVDPNTGNFKFTLVNQTPEEAAAFKAKVQAEARAQQPSVVVPKIVPPSDIKG